MKLCALGLFAVIATTTIGCGGEKTVVRKERTTTVEAVPVAPPVVERRTTTIETE
jgi:hypothetical protein